MRYFTCPTLANSTLVLWPPRNASRPPISGSTESTSNPVEVLPVASLTQPISAYGVGIVLAMCRDRFAISAIGKRLRPHAGAH
jgi:hypothetical protein